MSSLLVLVGVAACGADRRREAGLTPDRATAEGSPTTTSSPHAPPPAGIAAVQLFGPLGRYTEYVQAKVDQLHGQLHALHRAIAADDLSAARRAWLIAHLTWLQIGQDDGAYGAFGNLGGEIDGLARGDVGGVSSPRFTGFHRVELDLFRRDDMAAAGHAAAELTRLVGSITPAMLRADLPLNAVGLDSWVLRCHEILEDALRDSLSQNDDYGSNSDLDSVGADVSATREMLSLLSGLIEPRAPGLVKTGTRQLRAIDAALAATPARTEPAALPLRARQRIDAAVGAALETLAPVSELMQISNANS